MRSHHHTQHGRAFPAKLDRVIKDLPDFRDPAFLQAQALAILGFYDGRCVDPAGGFFHDYADDGRVLDPRTRHLVSSARFVVIHALVLQRFPRHARAGAWREAVVHGLRFLREAHALPGGGYAWIVDFQGPGQVTVLDPHFHAYGVACVLLAHAEALRAGCPEPGRGDGIAEAFTLLERRCWDPQRRAYVDPVPVDDRLSPYVGRSADVHASQVLLTAYEATGERPYLDRARTLAESIAERPLAVGAMAQWAKVLLRLERALPDLPDDNPLQHRARQYFGTTVDRGWDRAHGGLVGAFAADGSLEDGQKHGWAHAEAIAAAAVLAERTGEGGYWDWYDRLWAYAWEHLIDHAHGAWYPTLGADNRKLDQRKSPPGKTDFHGISACLDALEAISRPPR